MTAILVPKRDGRGRFVKLGARRYLVISIAMVAATVETDAADRIVAARIAVGACSAVARRLPALEADLAGVPVGEAVDVVAPRHLAGLSPIDDVRASAAYRMAAARALVADCLAAFAGPAAAAEGRVTAARPSPSTSMASAASSRPRPSPRSPTRCASACA